MVPLGAAVVAKKIVSHGSAKYALVSCMPASTKT